MPEKKIRCLIQTPEASLFEGDIVECVLPAVDGEWMVCYNHAPSVLMLGVGGLRLNLDNQWHHYYIESGVAQIRDNQLSILCDFALGKKHLSRENLQQELSGMGEKEHSAIQKTKAKLKVLDAIEAN